MVDALRSLERLLLPNSCVACGRLAGRASPDALVCALCSSRLRVVPVGCERCAQPLPPVGPCRFCADWPETLSHVRSAVWLGDEAREIVHYLKYEGYTKLARLAAQSIARVIPRPHSAVLVPVPLSRRRLRHRGYNQAEVIARELGRTWDVPCDSGVLIRTRDTKTQTALTPDERNSNVAGAFFASPAPSPRAEASSIILVDDVLTTGATLVAAAAALQEAGWWGVGAVTFARALPFEVRVIQGDGFDSSTRINV